VNPSSSLDAATLTFLGGAGTVTGSKYLVRAAGRQILLDCGLFQGLKPLRLRNWDRPPFDPRAVDAVLLSHAHLDHAGYLPILARNGFRGPIHCTPATASLLPIVLRDSAHIQEEDARRANLYGYTKHHPALSLYSRTDVDEALPLLQAHPYGERFLLAGAFRVQFGRAGHILGSATIDVEIEANPGVRLVFSGDLGRWGRPILRDPELVSDADILLIESTYGDRIHAGDSADRVAAIITETARRGGAVIIPSFAIGRTQELIWTIRALEDAGRLPLVSVFIDSPMAIDVTDLYCRHPEDHDIEMKLLMDQKRCPLCCRQYHLVRTAEESRALANRRDPMIIIAGSGMATGGRVLHHLKRCLPDHRNTVLLPGFQAAGTRGRALQNGARTIRIHGQDVLVRARVESIDGLSAHADQTELLRWMRGFRRPPARTYIVHGEPTGAEALAAAIRSELGWTADVAEDGATVPLG
jgi:metallo-beta-lactamase family protein